MCYNANYPTSEQGNTFLQTPQTQLWLTGEITFEYSSTTKIKIDIFLDRTFTLELCINTHVFSQLKTGWITNLHTNIWQMGAKGAKPFIQKHQNVFQCFQFWSLSLAACFPDMLVIFFTADVCWKQSCHFFFFKSSQPIKFPEGWFDRELETRTANGET